MRDEDKATEQLVGELTALRQQVAELEAARAEHERAAENLRASEVKHRLLLTSIRSPVLALGEDMTVLYCNEAYAELVGKSATAMEGENLLALFPDLVHTRPLAALRQALETGEIREVEGRLGGHYLHARVYRTPWGVLTITEDITERKRAEEALRESEEKYRMLVEQSFQGTVIVQGPPLHLAFANPAVAQILGYTPEELTQSSPEEIQRMLHPEDLPLALHREGGAGGQRLPSPLRGGAGGDPHAPRRTPWDENAGVGATHSPGRVD